MHIINSPEYLEIYPALIRDLQYGIFGIFREEKDDTLSLGFGDFHHKTLCQEMEDGRKMIGGGSITVGKDGYKIIGKTSQALDYPELPLEFMQSISEDVCRILQTNSLSIAVREDIVRIK